MFKPPNRLIREEDIKHENEILKQHLKQIKVNGSCIDNQPPKSTQILSNRPQKNTVQKNSDINKTNTALILKISSIMSDDSRLAGKNEVEKQSRYN